MATQHEYTYLLADLLSNTILGELPARYVSFNSTLNDIGEFECQILGSDPVVRQMDIWNITEPGRTAIYVDRDGTLVWGGIIWQRTYTGATRLGQDFVIQITANEFLSYFQQRLLLNVNALTHSSGGVYTNVDQLTIASDLVNYAQSLPSGNIGVYVPPPPTSGVDVTVTYLNTDATKVYDALTTLSQTTGGFDFAIDVGYGIGGAAAGVPGKVLTLSYPRRGRVAAQSQLVWEFPGNVVEYEWPEDATNMANTVFDTGPGSGSDVMTSTASYTAPLDAGYPLLELSFNYNDSGMSQTLLDAHAQSDVQTYAYGTTLPQISVRSDEDPVLGSYITGDEGLLRITDFRFNTGTDSAGNLTGPGYYQNWRINEIQVTPQDQDEPEQVVLTLGTTVEGS